MDTTLFDVIAKHGISVMTVGAGTYILFYLVKNTVVTMSAVVTTLADKVKELSTNLSEFAGHVRREHSEGDDNQKAMQDNQKEMVKQLQEITVTLGRINGYK